MPFNPPPPTVPRVIKAEELAMTKKVDLINHPPHYKLGSHEVIDVIESWGLGYHLGNVIKYIARSKRKGHESEDLQKAQWYLNRYIKEVMKCQN
jgi:hypothetical protein